VVVGAAEREAHSAHRLMKPWRPWMVASVGTCDGDAQEKSRRIDFVFRSAVANDGSLWVGNG
jgi:hypothetical protein